VIVNAACLTFPTAAGVFEVADQFTFLGIDADDRQMAELEIRAEFGQVLELPVAVGAGTRGNLFIVHVQGVTHLVKQARDRIGRDENAERGEFLGDRTGGAAAPPQSGHGIAGSIVFQQIMKNRDYFRRFFS
jgi:hypothetical protein